MARRKEVLACKPEDLFLAVSQVEQQLAQKSLKALGGRKKSLLDNVGAYNSSYQFRMEVIGPTRIRYNSSFVYKGSLGGLWHPARISPNLKSIFVYLTG